MARITDARIDGRRLVVTVSGAVNPTNATDLVLAIRKKALDSNALQILVDASGVNGKIDTVERLDLADVLPPNLADLQLAMVLSKDLLPSGTLAEGVAARRGFRVRAFSDVDKARQWLDVIREDDGKESPH